MKKFNYEKYIRSSQWKNRRAIFFQRHDHSCSACTSKRKIHLHHKSYDRVGREPDRDLVALCEICHSEVHRLHNGSNASLREITDLFIEAESKRSKRGGSMKKNESSFVPRNQRNMVMDDKGRMRNPIDWKQEVSIRSFSGDF